MFYLKSLKLTDFRCHQNLFLTFARSVNIIIGKNASGKTSIVEAIHCLGLGKSYKAGSNTEMIRKGAPCGIIRAEIVNQDKNDELLFSLSPNSKKVALNNKTFARLSDYLGYFNVSVFCPEDYRLIKGTPRDRRNFFDISISQLSSGYLNASIRYRKILKQRNEMLKMIAGNQGYDRILLKILTEQLIKEGTTIINERKKFISALNPLFNNKTKQISSGKEQGVIKYLMNTDIDRLEQVFSQKIVNEIAMQTTLFGPHRDDFEIKINGENAGTFASQGQQRTLLLASKLALTEMLANKDSPLVIILDDVFSELDSARQNQLLSMINRDFQIFITTTSIESLASKLLEHSKIIEIEEEE